MKIKLLIGLSILSLLLVSGCSGIISSEEATIKILEYSETHTRAECMVYCEDLIFSSWGLPNGYNERGCLRRCT